MTDRAGNNSSGGVRNLLARFEAKTENTPPPSRGRSPVSVERGRSTSSRPLSKVRTSFVAVERSGQLGPMLGVRKLSEGEMAPMANESGDTKEAATRSEDGHKQSPKANGTANGEATHALPDVAEEEAVNGTKEETLLSNESRDVEVSMASPMGSKNESEGVDSTTASEGSPLAQKSAAPSTTAEEEKVTVEEEKDVGQILKGSPFEDGRQPKMNGSPKKDNASKKSPAKASSPNKPSAKEKSDQTSPSAKPAANKSTTSRPSPISTKKDGPPSSKAPLSGKSGASKNSPKVSNAPKTPSTSTSQEPVAEATPPRQPVRKSSPKVASKDRAITSSKPSGEGSKPPNKVPLTNGTASGAAKSSLATGDPTKKVGAVPGKPQPKSPTRPVRLPAAATSSTAASAAKLGGPPSRSPSRAGTTATVRKPPAAKKDAPAIKSRPAPSKTSTATQVRRKVSRPSLPPQSHEPTKPRTSIAPDEGFLARMMRPTAASASKVNEKIETRSPPRKTAGAGHPTPHPSSHAAKPKRKSEIKNGVKEEEKDVAQDGKIDEAPTEKTTETEAVKGNDDHAVLSNEPGTAETNEATAETHAVNSDGHHTEASEMNSDEVNEPQLTDPNPSEPVAA